MARITRCKNLQKDMITKDPNFGIFLDTNGKITNTYQIEWPRVYAIFDNDYFSNIQDNQLAYQRIRDSGLHSIAVRPTILPYNDAIKWIVEHANPKDRSFNDSAGSQLANFCPEIFTWACGLKLARQLLNAKFAQSSKTRFNFNENLKSWMHEPGKLSQRIDDLYLVTWFKEPYSLLEAMLCRLYGLPSCH